MPVTDLSSKNRMIDVDTPRPKGELVVERFSGVEELGRMFRYEIYLLSEKRDIPFDEVLGKHITLLLECADGSRRPIDGRVSEFGLIGAVDNLFRYRIVAVPWTWMMTRTADCKIFQEKTVPEIIKAVFADQGDADFKLSLTGTYAKRTYCVQYRESDFNFVSRLMEEEGIYYFFDHEPGKHTMMICDASGAHQSIGQIPYRARVGNGTRFAAEAIYDWSVARQIQPTLFAQRDYNFETPSTDLLVKTSHDRTYAEAGHEIYDYPGEYLKVAEGDPLARVRLEEIQCGYETVEGRGAARTMACGSTFTFSEFPREDQNADFLIVSTRIEASNNALESVGGGNDASFEVTFRLAQSSEPFRTERTTRRPFVQGPQTALVVGPAGEEIFVDKYGRVKVQFYWDRYGNKDDKSSCWIRVSQIWAGKNYGWMTIPRIGQEVVVSFLEGDPDQPLITGRVYNAEQMPPWALPANKTQSGLLTRSSVGGSPANANELRFEDKKGSEQVYLHAEKNQDIEVENDETHWVGHDRKKTVDNDENVEVKNNRTEKVGVNEKITIGSNRTEEVGANEDITVKGNRTESVKGNEELSVTGNQKESITGSRTLDVTGSEKITVKSSHEETIMGSATQKVIGSLDQTVIGGINITTPAAMNVKAVGGVTFTAPGGFTVIAPGGTKTIDSFFDRIGLKTDEIFSIKTDILLMQTSIVANSINYAHSKIDTAFLVAEAIATKSANTPITIGQAVTEVRNAAVSIWGGGPKIVP